MHLSKITDYDKLNLSANNPAAGAVDMWVTGQFQLSTFPSAHKYYGDIFAEQLGVTLSLNTNTLGNNSQCTYTVNESGNIDKYRFDAALGEA